MPISSPSVPVYYYECSNGRFRLTYFIPFSELVSLVDNGKMNGSILKDYPDGLDLDCTEPDFKELELLYGYRPKHSPDMLRNAFLAIFSSTWNWKKFRGTGYINAKEIENQLAPLQTEMGNKQLIAGLGPLSTQELPATKKQTKKRVKRKMESQLNKFLRSYAVSGVDKSKGLQNQNFIEIQMEGGSEDVNQFFARLTKKNI